MGHLQQGHLPGTFSVKEMAVLFFLCSVRGVHFYDVNVSSVREGGRVAFQLEPTNV